MEIGKSIGWSHPPTIEEILKEFPLKKVRKAKKFCENAYSVDNLQEQIYRAHYSSLKIKWSWEGAKFAMIGIAYLLGYIDESKVKEDIYDTKIEEQEVRKMTTKIFRRSYFGKMFSHMKKERFYGHIPLVTGIYALGAKAIFSNYLFSVCKVLEKLHQNKEYREGIDRGVINWEEAMLLKTFIYLKRK